MLCRTTQHNTTQHNTTQHNTTQHNTTQHNTTQHNTTQHNLKKNISVYHIIPLFLFTQGIICICTWGCRYCVWGFPITFSDFSILLFDDPSSFWVVNNSVIDVKNSLFDVNNSLFDVNNSLVDVNNSLVDVNNSLVDVKNPLVDVKNPLVDVNNSVFDVNNSVWVDPNSLFDVNISLFDDSISFENVPIAVANVCFPVANVRVSTESIFLFNNFFNFFMTTRKDWLPSNHESLYNQAKTTFDYLTEAVLTRIGVTGNAFVWYNGVFVPKHSDFGAAFLEWRNPADRTPAKTATLITAETGVMIDKRNMINEIKEQYNEKDFFYLHQHKLFKTNPV